MEERERIKAKISSLRAELAELEDQLEELDNEDQARKLPADLPLRLDEYRRYGRQMILPGIGLPGQLKIKQANVLVIGAGGLGCPFLLYLAGAGIGSITIVDADTVEVSNLHRQVLHSQSRVGMPKVESARLGIKSLNPRVKVRTINERFNRALLDSEDKASKLDLSSFDMMVDCTDNAPTRYLLSDLAIQHNITLVSGGAVGLEGWVGVWNLPAPYQASTSSATQVVNGQEAASSRGPCLRCIYPQLQHDNSGNCEDDGILGTVVGTIGLLMANEAIKLLVGLHDLKPSMTLFSPLSSPMFRTLKLRGRKAGCPGCSAQSHENDTKAPAINGDNTLVCGTDEQAGDTRINAKDLDQEIHSGKPYVLIDTRPEVEYGICALPDSINIPHSRILRDEQALLSAIPPDTDAYIVCRRGNDSLLDARLAKELLKDDVKADRIHDLRGGLQAWHRLHPEFPLY